MNMPLGAFEECFARALLEDEPGMAKDIQALSCQPGFAVYRNTVMKSCLDALRANYPAVVRLVGETWFLSAALHYVRQHPPRDARLLYYGDTMPTFLASLDSAAGLPYLRGVACLDRFWTEAHCAADKPTLNPADLAGLAPEMLAEIVLRPHCTARWAWFREQPVHTIWRNNRYLSGDCSEANWHGEGALLVRPQADVSDLALDAAACAFLDICGAGRPLKEAAVAAASAQANVDLAGLLSMLIRAGAFGQLR